MGKTSLSRAATFSFIFTNVFLLFRSDVNLFTGLASLSDCLSLMDGNTGSTVSSATAWGRGVLDREASNVGHRHFRPSGAAISRNTEDHLRLRLKDCYSRLYFDLNLIPGLVLCLFRNLIDIWTFRFYLSHQMDYPFLMHTLTLRGGATFYFYTRQNENWLSVNEIILTSLLQRYDLRNISCFAKTHAVGKPRDELPQATTSTFFVREYLSHTILMGAWTS